MQNFKTSDYHVSMKKRQLRELSVGEFFMPIQGTTSLKGYELIEKGGLGIRAKSLEDGTYRKFNWLDKVVLIHPKNASRKVQIVEMDVETFTGHGGYYEGSPNYSYKFPVSVSYQISDRFGRFNDIPTSIGMIPGSDEHKAHLEAWDTFLDNCPSIKFDLADLFSALASKSLIVDFSVEKRFGIVWMEDKSINDGNAPSITMTFEEAYEYFDLKDYRNFILDLITVKNIEI